jgi:DNA-binding transcriptional regulator WhiA
MAGKKGSKLMNQKYFNEIKKLLEANVPIKYVQDITKRSSYTVRLVSKSETYKDYQQFNRARFVKNTPPPIPSDVSGLTPSKTEFIQVLDKISGLEDMLSKLLRIFEEKESHANVSFWKR